MVVKLVRDIWWISFDAETSIVNLLEFIRACAVRAAVTPVSAAT
jgi:hypothetical protein